MDRVIITARPSARNVSMYVLNVLPISLSATQQKTIYVVGKSFFSVRNIYLSGSDPNIFASSSYTYFDPFSAFQKLSAKNVPFYGSVIPEFIIADDKLLSFEIPDNIFYEIVNQPTPYSSNLDIIIENEAGYGLLTRDSITYGISSWSGFVNEQYPCISGIEIKYVQ